MELKLVVKSIRRMEHGDAVVIACKRGSNLVEKKYLVYKECVESNKDIIKDYGIFDNIFCNVDEFEDAMKNEEDYSFDCERFTANTFTPNPDCFKNRCENIIKSVKQMINDGYLDKEVAEGYIPLLKKEENQAINWLLNEVKFLIASGKLSEYNENNARNAIKWIESVK